LKRIRKLKSRWPAPSSPTAGKIRLPPPADAAAPARRLVSLPHFDQLHFHPAQGHFRRHFFSTRAGATSAISTGFSPLMKNKVPMAVCDTFTSALPTPREHDLKPTPSAKRRKPTR